MLFLLVGKTDLVSVDKIQIFGGNGNTFDVLKDTEKNPGIARYFHNSI